MGNGQFSSMEDEPLPGRSCGECTVCCTALTIDQPEMQKLPGQTCTNCVAGNGCAIYHTRPSICRSWFCGWRQLDWIAETLRPDRAHVLICLTEDGVPGGMAADVGLEFTLLAEAGLQAVGLGEALARALRSNLATFVTVPGRPGAPGARFLVNETLAAALKDADPAMLLRDLSDLYATLRLLSGAGSFAAIAFAEHPVVAPAASQPSS